MRAAQSLLSHCSRGVGSVFCLHCPAASARSQSHCPSSSTPPRAALVALVALLLGGVRAASIAAGAASTAAAAAAASSAAEGRERSELLKLVAIGRHEPLEPRHLRALRRHLVARHPYLRLELGALVVRLFSQQRHRVARLRRLQQRQTRAARRHLLMTPHDTS